MKYINIKNNNGVETVDQFETKKEAAEMLLEYRKSDSYNHYYISQKSTNNWKYKKK